MAAKFKRDIESAICLFIRRMPRFEKPIMIHFHWVEENKRRDYDNVAFGKKFILDAMVKARKLKDDNRKCVAGFWDTFGYGKKAFVMLEIYEIEEGMKKLDATSENSGLHESARLDNSK